MAGDSVIAEVLNRKRMRIVAQHCRVADLDIGAGMFPKARFAIDLKRRFRPDVLADAQRLPIRSGSVESVVLSHVLEHTDEEKVLSETGRVLKKGGAALFFLPDDSSSLWKIIKPIWALYYGTFISSSDTPLSHRETYDAETLALRLEKHFDHVKVGRLNLGMELWAVCSCS